MLPLGLFRAGTGIGFVLIADGFTDKGITSGQELYYSNAAFNPEPATDKKKHSLLLKDAIRDKLVLAFEDTRRDDRKCDDDFNDALFFLSVDPAGAVNSAGIPAVNYSIKEADGDGIADNFDDYPTDAAKAFNNFYPSANKVNTLAFEDLWPSTGDHDFNDMVVEYQVNQVSNSQNKVT